MKKKIALLIEEQYQDLEVWVPYYRLKEAGFDVFLLGKTKGATYRGKYGYPAQAEEGYSDVKAADLGGVVVPGGFAPDYMRRYPEPAAFVKEIFDQGGLVAAICHGPWLLVSAGILKDRTATCFFGIADDVKNAGARYVDRDVVVNGNIITSRKPEDLPAFCSAIVKYLNQ